MTCNLVSSSQSSAFVTKGDRTRITHALLTTVLLHQAGAAQTNVAIARMTGTSVHQVSAMRKLMSAMGTLGTIMDRPLPNLPQVPETTWSEFHSVLWHAKEFSDFADEKAMSVPSLSSLRALIAAGEALREAQGVSLIAVASLTAVLQTAYDLANYEYQDILPPLTPEEAAEAQANLSRYLSARSHPLQ